MVTHLLSQSLGRRSNGSCWQGWLTRPGYPKQQALDSWRFASVSKVESNQERHKASTLTSTSVCRHMNAHSHTHCVHVHTCKYAHTHAHHIHTDAKLISKLQKQNKRNPFKEDSRLFKMFWERRNFQLLVYDIPSPSPKMMKTQTP